MATKTKSSSTTISIRFDNDNIPAGVEVLKEFAKLILEKFDDASSSPKVEVKNEH
jgi:hypothetical protein